MERKAKILVIDDDPDILVAVCTILEAHNHHVVTAPNGARGLEILRLEKPDLIILDLLMPQMDGFAFLKTIGLPTWSKFGKLPIILLTSIKKDVADRRYELEMGMPLPVNAYLEKPVNPRSLIDRVEWLLAKKHPRAASS